ncbi:MAG: hypothetical protein ACOCQD_02940 [archaeon]
MYENFKVLPKDENIASLDVLFTFAYSGSVSGSRKRVLYYSSVYSLIEHNLKLKHENTLSSDEIKKKLRVLEDENLRYGFKFTNPNLFNLQNSLFQNNNLIIKKDILNRFNSLNVNDKQIIKFLLNQISLSTEKWKNIKSQTSAPNIPVDNIRILAPDNLIESYSISSGNEEDQEDCMHWIKLLNEKISRDLNHYNTIDISHTVRKCGRDTNIRRQLYACELGDIVVKSGLGYWVPWVAYSDNVHVYLKLKIPKPFYDIGMENIYLLEG